MSASCMAGRGTSGLAARVRAREVVIRGTSLTPLEAAKEEVSICLMLNKII